MSLMLFLLVPVPVAQVVLFSVAPSLVGGEPGTLRFQRGSADLAMTRKRHRRTDPANVCAWYSWAWPRACGLGAVWERAAPGARWREKKFGHLPTEAQKKAKKNPRPRAHGQRSLLETAALPGPFEDAEACARRGRRPKRPRRS